MSGTRDRSKASQHAIFLLREIRAPAPAIAAALPRAAGRLDAHIANTAASYALPVALDVSLSASDWRIAIDAFVDDTPQRYFEGIIRLERISPDVTGAALVGRFIFPHAALYPGVGGQAAHELAESDLTRIFEALLRGLDATVAAR
jgi:hypothetical protein